MKINNIKINSFGFKLKQFDFLLPINPLKLHVIYTRTTDLVLKLIEKKKEKEKLNQIKKCLAVAQFEL